LAIKPVRARFYEHLPRTSWPKLKRAACRVLRPFRWLVARNSPPVVPALHYAIALWGEKLYCEPDQMVLDAGPKTVDLIKDAL